MTQPNAESRNMISLRRCFHTAARWVRMQVLVPGAVAISFTLPCALPAFGQEAIQTVPPESVGLSSKRLGKLDTLIDHMVDEKRVAGGIVLIARRGSIAYFNAFGLADRDKAMQKDTIFRIASMSKPLTSTAIMLLYEEGRILLSDPISKYIPEFKNPKVMELLPAGSKYRYRLVPAKREITIHDLLTHTSGISYRFLANWYPDKKRRYLMDLYKEAGISDGLRETGGTIGEMVKTLARLPLYSQPGEAFEYGLSTDVLGYLVEVVSGVSLAEFMERRIFKPLKMNDTSFYLPEEKLNRLSALWVSDGRGRLEKMTEGPKQEGDYQYSSSFHYKGPGTYYSGGSGLLSTASDYLRFCQMLLNRGELDGVRLLSRKSVQLMTATNHIGALDATLLHGKGWKFGLGFAIEEDRGHDIDSGSIGVYEWAGIFSTRFSIDPQEEKITIFLSQTHPFQQHFSFWDRVTALSASAIAD